MCKSLGDIVTVTSKLRSPSETEPPVPRPCWSASVLVWWLPAVSDFLSAAVRGHTRTGRRGTEGARESLWCSYARVLSLLWLPTWDDKAWQISPATAPWDLFISERDSVPNLLLEFALSPSHILFESRAPKRNSVLLSKYIHISGLFLRPSGVGLRNDTGIQVCLTLTNKWSLSELICSSPDSLYQEIIAESCINQA